MYPMALSASRSRRRCPAGVSRNCRAPHSSRRIVGAGFRGLLWGLCRATLWAAFLRHAFPWFLIGLATVGFLHGYVLTGVGLTLIGTLLYVRDLKVQLDSGNPIPARRDDRN
jgi:hypothetical protein